MNTRYKNHISKYFLVKVKIGVLIRYAPAARHRQGRPRDVLQGLAGRGPALPLDRTPRRRHQQRRLGERQPENLE